MTTESIALPDTEPRRNWSVPGLKNSKRVISYAILLLLPFIAANTLNMDNKGTYVTILSICNLVAMMAFFVQFPLAGRIRQLSLFANIDWSMSNHKKVGQWLGVFFFLHPLLILAPRFLVSFGDGMSALTESVTAPQMLTGVIAWLAMLVWVLTSVFKNRLKMSYETWRLTHMLGFVVITVLATLHITSVGSHGQFEQAFNLLWWGLCSLSVLLVIYNYLGKKAALKAKPFKLVDVKKVSSRDWQVMLEKGAGSDFSFEAGQFVWMNTTGSVHSLNEHPFSIASCKSDLPKISMIIRELGDYTSKLGSLTIGRDVYIDGPYGSMSLSESEKAKGITLIAGGAGIGPMLSLLRDLAAKGDTRPVRLIYGNNSFDQMVLQEEINELEKQMPDFRQQLVCMLPTNEADIYQGVIDEACIGQVMSSAEEDDWAVYLCGPEVMIKSVNKSLKSLRIPASNIHYEQLSF